MNKNFDKWDYRYMEMAELVGKWSNCLRDDRHVGSVAVLDKRVICTAYNGAPVGIMSCKERGECIRLKLGIGSAKSPEICYSVHSEQVLICNAAKQGLSLQGCTVYCTHQPCVICLKLLINAGVARVVYKEEYPDEFCKEIAREINFPMLQIGDDPNKPSRKRRSQQEISDEEQTEDEEEFEDDEEYEEDDEQDDQDSNDSEQSQEDNNDEAN